MEDSSSVIDKDGSSIDNDTDRDKVVHAGGDRKIGAD